MQGQEENGHKEHKEIKEKIEEAVLKRPHQFRPKLEREV